jgi:hypothetical protein
MRPQLLLDHAQGYAALVAQELSLLRTQWRLSAMLYAVAFCCLSGAATLGGMAVLLWAAMPTAQLHLPWVLWFTPLLPLVCGLVCLRQVNKLASKEPFADLYQQIQEDLAMLRVMNPP